MMLVSLWLLLATMVGVTMQQCTRTRFAAIASTTIMATTDTTQNITINQITYNCLSASSAANNGTYASMSVSILYSESNSPNQLHGIRYNLNCRNDEWYVSSSSVVTLIGGTTRVNCSSCLDQTVNEYHCSRKYY